MVMMAKKNGWTSSLFSAHLFSNRLDMNEAVLKRPHVISRPFP